MFRYSKNSLRYASLKWNNFILVEKKLRRKALQRFVYLFHAMNWPQHTLIRATCFIFFLLPTIGKDLFSNNNYIILLVSNN